MSHSRAALTGGNRWHGDSTRNDMGISRQFRPAPQLRRAPGPDGYHGPAARP
ncbi:hypothetical protein ACFOLD_02330 [Kocuria carniphila]|uniref:hypothetical protein n=1 Tax=Kocuria carniphila TaxID=262208 RepID=UPI00361A939D